MINRGNILSPAFIAADIKATVEEAAYYLTRKKQMQTARWIIF